MLDLFLDDSHRALARSAQGWVDRHIAPHAAAWEEAGAFPRALHPEAAAAGLVGTVYPEALGGQGGMAPPLAALSARIVFVVAELRTTGCFQRSRRAGCTPSPGRCRCHDRM